MMVIALILNSISHYNNNTLKGLKYRDEARPRSGLMRAREFVMKDMYSFDVTQADAIKTYDEVYKSYENVFKRLGLNVVVAEADSGNIGIADVPHSFNCSYSS